MVIRKAGKKIYSDKEGEASMRCQRKGSKRAMVAYSLFAAMAIGLALNWKGVHRYWRLGRM